MEKILIGYHEVVSAFSVENRKLKQVNYNLNEQYEKMAKDLFKSVVSDQKMTLTFKQCALRLISGFIIFSSNINCIIFGNFDW